MPTVAVQPIYCLSPQEVPRLQLLAAIDSQTVVSMGYPLSHYRMRSDRDRSTLAQPGRDGPALRPLPGRPSSHRQCSVALRTVPLRKAHLSGPGPAPGCSPEEALADLARTGLSESPHAREAYGSPPPSDVSARLERELAAIGSMATRRSFSSRPTSYAFARQNDIPVSTRGSVANSLVAYCTGITTVDPVAHDLLFERFLSPARADAPDIDLDFCSRLRDEVLAYVRRTYGEERVSLVATVSTLQLRSAVRETGKAYGLEEAEIDRLTSLLPVAGTPTLGGAIRERLRTSWAKWNTHWHARSYKKQHPSSASRIT